MDSDISRLLDKLENSARTHKDEARSVGDVIEKVESRLASMNLEVDTWVEAHPLAVHQLSVSASNVAPRVEDQLGWGRRPGERDGARCLLIREAEYVPDQDLPTDGAYKLIRVLKVRPLARASASEQMAALSRVAELLEQLTETLENRTETVRGLRKLVD